MPARKAATKPLPFDLQRQAVGEEGEAERGQRDGRPERSNPAASGRVSSHPPTSPMPTPMPAPTRSSRTALPRRAAWVASVETAPARKRLTNGVAMPSFSPLSTLSSRRIRFGMRRVLHDRGPERRVGRRHDGPDRGGRPDADAREHAERHRRAEPDGERAARWPAAGPGSPRSCRSWWTLTREASVNSTRASVTSANDRIFEEWGLISMRWTGPWVTTSPMDHESERSADRPPREHARHQRPQHHAGGHDHQDRRVQAVLHRCLLPVGPRGIRRPSADPADPEPSLPARPAAGAPDPPPTASVRGLYRVGQTRIARR